MRRNYDSRLDRLEDAMIRSLSDEQLVDVIYRESTPAQWLAMRWRDRELAYIKSRGYPLPVSEKPLRPDASPRKLLKLET